jgi:hypothetical protein
MPNEIRVQKLLHSMLREAGSFCETKQDGSGGNARFFSESPKLTYSPRDFRVRFPNPQKNSIN